MKRTNTAVWLPKYNRWQIKVQKSGERKTFYSSVPGRNGQREANRKADLWLDEGVEDQSLTVTEAYQEYLEDIKARTSSGNGKAIKSRYDCHVEPVIGKVKVAELNDGTFQKVLNKAFLKSELSDKSLKNLRADLFGFAKFCRKNKYTTFLPEDIVIPSAAEKSHKLILQPDEVSILFKSKTTISHGKEVSEPFIYAFRFQVLTGLRPGELIGLLRNSVKDGVLYVERSVNSTNEITKGKNKNAIRSIPLSQQALDVIKEQREADPYSVTMFPVPSQKVYRSHLKDYCKANGITEVTPYELRHTFVSIAKTLPAGIVKDVVGHSANMDTFGVYGHKISGEDQLVASELEGRFAQIVGKK